MATHEIPIGSMKPDSSGEVYQSDIQAEASLSNAKNQDCVVFEDPSAADIGVNVKFRIPQNYAGTPKLILVGILNGTPANILAFGAKQNAIADAETIDVAYEAEDLVNKSSWTGYADEEQCELTITLTPSSAYQVGDMVYMNVFRDYSVDTTTMEFLMTGLFFSYSDT